MLLNDSCWPAAPWLTSLRLCLQITVICLFSILRLDRTVSAHHPGPRRASALSEVKDDCQISAFLFTDQSPMSDISPHCWPSRAPTSPQLSTKVVLGNTSDWRYLVQTLLKSGLLLELDQATHDRFSAYSNPVSAWDVFFKGFSWFSTQKGSFPW